MKLKIIQIISVSIPLLLPVSGSGAELGTRQRTITPVAVAPYTPFIYPADVAAYAVYGYSSWQWGPGTNEGRKFLTPSGDTGATNQARLLSYFSMSDIHITDKESPVQVPYMGWSADFGQPGPGGLNPNSYSPVMFDTTYHLDAAVRTINALHRLTPFDFGISLGDDCNSSQYNELRWFIDVMDGQYITPSSGDHLGATNIDYQMPFQAAGLDHSIPWYDAIGNHDQMWMGIGYPTPKLQQAMVGANVLNMSTNPLLPGASEGTGMYVGVVDGTTPFGTVIKWGLTNLYATPPTVAADTNRHSLTMDISSPTNYVNEFFNTTSFPQGHGFNRANTGSLAACYTFLPLTNMPIKMIVLDDTCKSNLLNQGPTFYGGGWIDAARFTWLTNELQMGQDSNQLMILACHIPISPQADLFNTNSASPQFYDYQTETNLIATLHNYPNLILLMAGHRHISTVTPQPSPDPAHLEYGFWEVETPSLRDFPRQFRTWEILRNSDNSISILTTSVDPVVETNSPAWKSLGYGIGAQRVFGTMKLTDTTSHTYNAELVKILSTNMQTKIANYGGPLGHRVAVDRIGAGVAINFLGELQSADTVLGPWSDVTDTSPYAVSATNGEKFYRACESDNSNSTPKATDYSKTNHWLTVPATNMPVDIFYLYPTSWTSTNSNPEVCAIDNPSMLQKAPQAFAKQATAFETVGNIYAPFYRQDNLSPSNRLEIIAGIPTLDAVAAFDYYIKNFNNGRPFILAGHSQGSDVLSNLLAGYMKAHPVVLARMIAAYVIGFPITAEYLTNNPHLKFAEGPGDTGVIISYNTEAPDVLPGANPVLSGLIGVVINPLTWTRAETLATTNQGFGSFMPNTNGVYVRVPQYADARIDISNGVLICSSADKNALGTIDGLAGFGVYHNFDYPFYYFNIRSNAANRVTKFLGSSMAAEQ
jgi:metallophosphoesterase (TIGR03768 family)